MYKLSTTKKVAVLAAAMSCFFVTKIAFADEGQNDEEGRDRVIKVNCNKQNASVQRKLDRAPRHRDVTIFIKGYCDESVLIERDGVTLSGNRDGDGSIDGGLREVQVLGSTRVTIEYLELTGDGYGVLAQDGSSVNVMHNNIHDNEFDGIGAFSHVFVRAYYNQIVRNGRPAPFFEGGIDAGVGAAIRSAGNYIAENGYAAVTVGNQGYFRSGFFTAGGPPDPADQDVILQKGCNQGDAAGTCGEPGTIALEGFRNGILDIRNTQVTGETFVSGLSNLDVRTSSFHGDVGASGGSRVHLRSSVTGSGDVSCFTEAFASSFVQCGDVIPPPP